MKSATWLGPTPCSSLEALRQRHSAWIQEALARTEQVREAKWTESVAVGSGDFVESVKKKLGVRGKGRRITQRGAEALLREPQGSYSDDFGT